MNALTLVWSYVRTKPLNTLLNVLLLSLGIAIITVLLLVSRQIEETLTRNSEGIDLVVGAKGSPLQIILSSVFQLDFPTGNISLQEAQKLSRNRLVRHTIPLAMGDSYRGHRIIGTDPDYISLYKATVAQGRLWKKPMEVTLGAQVAQQLNLSLQDTFYSSHGLTSDNLHVHEQPFTVVGILAPSYSVADNLILTSLESVWEIHETHDADTAIAPSSIGTEREITALLVQYRSPLAAVQLPRYINQRTNLQAASPPFEIARLFSLIGVGAEMLRALAYVIVLIAALSIFIALYNALQERRLDLAIMRSLGASRITLFRQVVLEGLLITFLGSLLGLLLGHLTLVGLIKLSGTSDSLTLSGTRLLPEEGWLVLGSLVVGAVAALLPAIKAYKTNISDVLAEG